MLTRSAQSFLIRTSGQTKKRKGLHSLLKICAGWREGTESGQYDRLPSGLAVLSSFPTFSPKGPQIIRHQRSTGKRDTIWTEKPQGDERHNLQNTQNERGSEVPSLNESRKADDMDYRGSVGHQALSQT